MSLPASLQAVINEMDMQGYMMHDHLNYKTGELISITGEQSSLGMNSG